MHRHSRVCAFLGFALLLAGCGPVRDLDREECTTVAWYIEDLAHGQERRPGELALVDGSAAMARIATWAAGGSAPDRLPSQLESRRMRWSVLRALFRQRLAVVLEHGPESGLVAGRPDLSHDDQAMVLPVVDAENQDRRNLDGLILTIAHARAGTGRLYREQLLRARLQLDREGGAEVWPMTGSR
jgi:hypothetical protein